MTIFAFSVSRSLGHIIKHIMFFSGHGDLWQDLSPLRGSINTMTFLVIGAITLFFNRMQIIIHKTVFSIFSRSCVMPMGCRLYVLHGISGHLPETAGPLASLSRAIILALSSVLPGESLFRASLADVVSGRFIQTYFHYLSSLSRDENMRNRSRAAAADRMLASGTLLVQTLNARHLTEE